MMIFRYFRLSCLKICTVPKSLFTSVIGPAHVSSSILHLRDNPSDAHTNSHAWGQPTVVSLTFIIEWLKHLVLTTATKHQNYNIYIIVASLLLLQLSIQRETSSKWTGSQLFHFLFICTLWFNTVPHWPSKYPERNAC